MAPDTLPPDFGGCSRDCRKTGTHTLRWGRCGLAPEPVLPSKDDLRGQLIAAGLVSHSKTMDDGYRSVIVHSDEEAADRALAVFRDWMFGTPEEIAARSAEAAQSGPDDTVKLCEKARPGEHERRVRAAMGRQLVDRFQAMREDGEQDTRTVIEYVRDAMRGEEL